MTLSKVFNNILSVFNTQINLEKVDPQTDSRFYPIPDEVRLQVFNKMDRFGDLHSARLVCKQWFKLCQNPDVWELVKKSLGLSVVNSTEKPSIVTPQMIIDNLRDAKLGIFAKHLQDKLPRPLFLDLIRRPILPTDQQNIDVYSTTYTNTHLFDTINCDMILQKADMLIIINHAKNGDGTKQIQVVGLQKPDMFTLNEVSTTFQQKANEPICMIGRLQTKDGESTLTITMAMRVEEYMTNKKLLVNMSPCAD